jgi:hypothetical protein
MNKIRRSSISRLRKLLFYEFVWLHFNILPNTLKNSLDLPEKLFSNVTKKNNEKFLGLVRDTIKDSCKIANCYIKRI